MNMSDMNEQTFENFRYEWAKDWAVEDLIEAKEFVIDVLIDYYLLELPNNKKDFFDFLVCEKGYDEEDAKGYLEYLEEMSSNE